MFGSLFDLPEEEIPEASRALEQAPADVDLQALAREVLALLKEEMRLESERCGFKPTGGYG
jgi:hypothetical protein